MLFDKDLDTNKVPQAETIYPYLLYALHKEGGNAHRTKVVAAVGALMELQEKVLEMRGGKKNDFKFKNRVGYTMSQLRETGYIEPKEFGEKGYWYLSKKGEEVIESLEGDNGYNEAQNLRNIVAPIIDQHLDKKKKITKKEDPEETIVEDDDGVESDLEKIRNMDPFSFERLCIQLLKAMGGTMNNTKKSGDEGVDGIGYIEIGFVKFKVVMQAKRFKEDNKVQETDIRNFLGSINAKHAEKSVFITTSDFSQKANSLGNEHSITLINGNRLIELMRKHAIGYTRELNIDSF